MGFVREKAVKAVRKANRCDACSQMVEVGQPAVRWAGVQDGEFYNLLYHPECRAAEIELNDLRETFRNHDDWVGLFDLDWEDWRWLIEKHPVVAERKGITLAEVEEIERDQEAARLAFAARRSA